MPRPTIAQLQETITELVTELERERQLRYDLSTKPVTYHDEDHVIRAERDRLQDEVTWLHELIGRHTLTERKDDDGGV